MKRSSEPTRLLGAVMAGFLTLSLHAAARIEARPDSVTNKDSPSMAQNQASSSTKEANPLLTEWETPFGMPPFDRIKEDHYFPAFQEAIARTRQEAEAIAKSAELPTFANTIEALDASGELLDRIDAVFHNLRSAETNDRLQEIARQVAPLTSALRDDILLNEPLFARVKVVWQQHETLPLDTEQRKLIEETYKDFVRGGANLSADQKTRLRAINEELALLGLQFGDNLLKETNAYRLVIEKKEDLAVSILCRQPGPAPPDLHRLYKARR
jgi:peptidyl-dipeptidase Dcp